MSTSTLPKSIQAQAGAMDGGGDSTTGATGSQNGRTQHYRDFIGRYRQLPEDFLRIPSSYYPYEQQQQQGGAGGQGGGTMARQPRAIVARGAPLVDMIDISVVEAQLVKNYGLLRMDLYCKIRVGHMVCETQTCLNGAKNPKWDGVYQFSLKPGIDSFHLEIYDEKQFSLDEKIAWLYEPIPPEVFQGITVERWFPLSGRLGPNKEGSVLLVLSHKRAPMRASHFGRAAGLQEQTGAPLTLFVPAANQGPVITGAGGGVATTIPGDPQMPPTYIQPPLPPIPGQPMIEGPDPAGRASLAPVSDEDVNQLAEMFPSIDKAIIKAILENHQNNKEAAIGALLALG